MTYEEINALTINDVFFQLLYRLVDFSEIPENEERYIFIEEPNYDDLYNSIIIHESLSMPDLSAFEAELLVYQEELRVEEQARLDEIARKEALYARWNVIKNRDSGVPAFYALKSEIPNAEKYIKVLIEDISRKLEASDFLNALEEKDSEIVTEIESIQYMVDREQAYPKIGDQLDSIYKAFKYLKDAGVNIGIDGDAWLAELQSVKITYPKS